MADTIVSALAPVFVVMLLGFCAGKAKIIDNQNVAGLNTLVMWFALPIAMFVAIVKMPSQAFHAYGLLLLVLCVSMVAIFVAMLFIQIRWFGLSLGEASVQALLVASPNLASVGPPLLLASSFHEQAMLAVATALAATSITLLPMALTLLELDGPGGTTTGALVRFLRALRRSVAKPIVLAPVAAVVLTLCDLRPRGLALGCLEPLAQASAGAALFLTGLILSALPHTINRNILVSVLVANIIRPVLTAGVVVLFALGKPAAAQAILLMSIPAGLFGIVVSASFGVRPRVVGPTLVISSLFSIATLSAAIYLLEIM